MTIKVLSSVVILEIGIVLMSLGIGFYTLGTVLFFDRTLYLMANVPLSLLF